VDNLDAILSVPQIDAIFVGPNDMSISLGVPDDYAQEVYKTTVKGVIDECEARGLPTLVHHQTPELSEYWIEQGARFVLHGTDRRAMAEGFRTEFNRLRNKAGNL
jgi:4-hydroxy-2-oxoheptanedioate aldolase